MPFGSYVFLLVSQNLENDKWKIEKTFFLDSNYKETTNKYEYNQSSLDLLLP